jgi:large subunit ribosomal protein L25
MSSEKITAEKRTEFGKGAARRLRRENKIPAVVYGHGSEAIHLALPAHDTTMALRHHGKNALLELTIDGKVQLALTKQVQVDDLRRVIEHIDFIAVKAGEKVQAEIPVHVVGAAASGTMVVVEHATISVEAEATHVPEGIEVSVEGAGVGTMIHAGEIALPKGVTFTGAADVVVVHVTEPQVVAEPAESAAATEAEAPAAAE